MEVIWMVDMPQTSGTIEIKLDRYVKMRSGSSAACYIKIPGLGSCLLLCLGRQESGATC